MAAAGAFLAPMKKRCSMRQYSSRAAPEALITTCIAAAGTALFRASHQPWFFAAIANPEMKVRITTAAKEEEPEFFEGGAGAKWQGGLEPIGTGAFKPHLSDAPWLIVVFAQRWGETEDGSRYKRYYVPKSVGITVGLLITAIHQEGLVCLEHTPNLMKFPSDMCGRPASEKAMMILPVGYPS